MSVIPASVASSIARLDGAETAQINADAANPCLLHDFEGGAAAHHQQDVVEWQLVLDQHPADHLVDGIVATDVFGKRRARAVTCEETRGVQAAGFVEHPLTRSAASLEARPPSRPRWSTRPEAWRHDTAATRS